MRMLTRTTKPIEPVESALSSAREAAQTVRARSMELLDSDALHELLHRGQHVAVTAKGKGVELLDSDAAHELRRRAGNVVLAAKGDVVAVPKRTRTGIGVLLFAAGAVAGVAAAVVSRRMATPVPTVDTSYDDPAAQFPTKGGVIDLTSVAAEEGITDTPVEDMAALGDAEIGTTTGATLATSGAVASTSSTSSTGSTGSTGGTSNGRPSRTTKSRPEGTGATS